MSDILLIGKDLPDCIDFAEGFVPDRKLFTAFRPGTDNTNFESEGIFSTIWNRSSAISARSLILNAETRLSYLDGAVFLFDSSYFSQKFEIDRTETVGEAIDMMISGYQYFLNELLFRLEQKKEPFSIVFFVKTYPSRFENFHNGGRNSNVHPVSTIVSAAQNAFIALAENISVQVQDKSYLSVILARCDPQNDLYNSPHQAAKWISQGLDSLKAQKNHQTVKQAAVWLKAGAKFPGQGFWH